MLSWWTDVVREATHDGHHTRVVQLHHRYGMIMFIASEVMFFVAWFWAYFDASLFANDPLQYPAHRGARRHLAAEGHRDLRSLAPAAPQHLDPSHLRHHRDLGAPRAPAQRPAGPEGRACGSPIALGVLFTFVQAYEYSHAAFGFKGNIYGATFFMATGFHGAHVIIGTIFLAVCLLPRLPRPFHAAAASRLRVRRLVLALRRRGVAVPLRLDLRVGLWRPRRRRPLTAPTPITISRAAPAALRISGRPRLECRRIMPVPQTPARPFPRRRRLEGPLPALREGTALPGLPVAARRRCEACGLDYSFIDTARRAGLLRHVDRRDRRRRPCAMGRVHLRAADLAAHRPVVRADGHPEPRARAAAQGR